ncbi:hypothetical protein L6R49_10480 [Myxococcota bacterium]|nr:hypothetical protein [Myxococcota bacterium]
MNTAALDPHVAWDRCTTEKARLARVPQLDLICCKHLLRTTGLSPKVRAALKRQVAALDVEHLPEPGSKDELFWRYLRGELTVEEVAVRLGPLEPGEPLWRAERGLPLECRFTSADGFSGRGARRKGAA